MDEVKEEREETTELDETIREAIQGNAEEEDTGFWY